MAKGKSFGELILLAKGDDRSYREYQKDSGVDASAISKMAKETYIPKHPSVFAALTSSSAQPRNGVTYEDLINAANRSKEFQAGLRAASVGGVNMAVAATLTMANPIVGAMAAAVGMYRTSEDLKQTKKEQKKYEHLGQLYKEAQQFVAIVNGLIYGKLASKGIVFQQIAEDDNIFVRMLGLCTGYFKEYMLKYVFADKEERMDEKLIKNSARKAFDGLILLPILKERKVSYVVNCEELFIEMCKYKNKLSYAGNLSVIYVDQATVQIISEECICKFDDISEEEVLNMI